jgi:hypothetical protein
MMPDHSTGAIRANVPTVLKDATITKNRNTYAKRQREQEKKQRADDKRAKRVEKKEKPPTEPVPTPRD